MLGFRFGDIAYCTDVKTIPPESMERLRGLDTLILGALHEEKHPTHLSIPEAIELVRELKPKRTYLTHLSHRVDFDRVSQHLPENVELAYDGLLINQTLMASACMEPETVGGWGRVR